VHAAEHHLPQLPAGGVEAAIGPHETGGILLKGPVVVVALHLVGAPLHHVAKLVARAVDLLARELYHQDRVAIHVLQIDELHFANVQDVEVRVEPLQVACPEMKLRVSDPEPSIRRERAGTNLVVESTHTCRKVNFPRYICVCQH
jgi:hypothetical protein